MQEAQVIGQLQMTVRIIQQVFLRVFYQMIIKQQIRFFIRIPVTPGGSNLRNPTGRDFIEIRKGIRTIVPLLKFHKGGGIYIRNTAKFCKSWREREEEESGG